MKVKTAKLKGIAKKILTNRGLNDLEANIITEDYLDAEMRGKPSHGLAAFGVVANDAANRGHAEMVFDKDVVVFFDGKGDIGHLVGEQAIKLAVQRCHRNGVLVVGMKNIRRFATPGTLARKAALRGLVSMIFEYGGQAFMAPFGSADAIISTNPIGIGIPTNFGPIVLDMASSEKAFYFIKLAERLGTDIPSLWAIDSEGNPTTDPRNVSAVSPFGGNKGYAIAFMLEILTGPLLGVPVGLSGLISRRGALLFFLSPTLFGADLDEFSTRIKKLIKEIKSSRLAKGTSEIFYPGEQGEARLKRCLETGEIEIDEATWKSPNSLLEYEA